MFLGSFSRWASILESLNCVTVHCAYTSFVNVRKIQQAAADAAAPTAIGTATATAAAATAAVAAVVLCWLVLALFRVVFICVVLLSKVDFPAASVLHFMSSTSIT